MSTTDESAGTAPAAAPQAACTADADGRITFRVPAPAGPAPELLLRLRPKKGRPETTVHTLPLRPGGDADLRAVLETRPVLDEGRWDLHLVPGPGAARQRLRPGLRDLRDLVAGHLRERPSPVAVRVPYVTRDGHLALRAWLRPAHAEVDTVEITGAALTVRARLHGAALTGDAALRLRPRGGKGTALTVPVRGGPDGRGFTCTVDLAEAAATGTGESPVLDVLLDGAASAGGPAAPIRLGRLLDDIADRKEVFVFPAAPVGRRTVRPYYTVDNDLSLETRPSG
ncbi:hypothetical protein SZN_27476 [Streptomyces zinciresistens K42]|uniref:Transferase n=1 Tax=Streptomyces zinciresistens K42 TaxID=700597 RepID=G2GJ05_9ACTN|nr:hypothetical protein [Streptomyces zinciresistens]EGX56501.1 hypothetical protein SZN_27476 [Streptomyces zinciresistens K42]